MGSKRDHLAVARRGAEKVRSPRALATTSIVLALALAAGAGCSAGTRGAAAGGGLFSSPDSGGNAPPGPGGAVVAELELEAPTQSPFVLRGTVPLPPRTYPRPDGMTPLAVRNIDGNVVPTQLEIVSRYAAGSEGADVVEVLARVDLPPGTAPGQRVRYQVVEYSHPSGPLPIEPELVKFLMSRGNALLVAEDVFGNRYELDLFENLRAFSSHPRSRLLRKGPAAVQVRTYGVLRPTGPKLGAPDGALPHFLGVHAYLTAWADTRALSLDLRVHNGFDGHDKTDAADDPLGKVYFRWLELWLPVGWSGVQDVNDLCAGKPYRDGGWMRHPLIAPRSDGRMHVMPHQSSFNRRLGLAHTADVPLALHLAYDEGLAFCRRGTAPGGSELWSWWNPQTARYFPQRHVLPDLSFQGSQALENGLAGMYWMARTALETGQPGNYAVPSGALGWAHPWGVSYGGMTGAVEINLYDGLQLAEVGTNKGWKSMQWTHRMNTDRQPFSLYNRDGEPSSIEDWVQQGSFPYVDMNFWMNLVNGPDPFGFGNAPAYQVQHVAASGLQPGYEQALSGYMPHDFQHYVRYTRTPKALAWLGNDALSKDDLRQAAEIARMSMHEYPNSGGKWHTGAALFGLKQLVAANPGKGLYWGRGEAWSLDAVVAAFALGDPSYRGRALPWLRTCADLLAQGQVNCSGFLMTLHVPGWLTGEYLMRSQPEHTIIEHSLVGLLETVFRGADLGRTEQTRQVLADATRTVIGPISWSTSMQAPWFLAATAPLDLSQPSFCEGPPPGGVGNGPDGFFSWASFGYGYELSGDWEFLDKATAMSGGGNLLSNLIYVLNKGYTNVETAAALLALLQG